MENGSSTLIPQGHKDREKWERKGYLMQWTRVNKEFPVPPDHNPNRNITEEELLQHNTVGDCWTAVRGIVYDITDYIYYHPGGAEHLMRGAGRDCTDLFDEYHAWVSAEAYMAIAQRVGRLEMKMVPGRVNALQTLGAPKGGGKIEFFAASLEKMDTYNYNTNIFTFKLDKPMKLDLGQHVKMSSARGKPIMRSYTPLNKVGIAEELVILIKIYKDGAMSQALMKLESGSQIKFKPGKNRYNLPRQVKHVGLIAGGTGIAPIYQLIQALLKTKELELSLLFSNVIEADILLKEKLDEYQAAYPTRFKVHYLLTNPADSWTGLRGRIDQEKMKEYLPAPGSTTQICVCGPVAMTNAMERMLHEVGYTSEMVHLFL